VSLRRIASLLSGFLAIASASVGLMAVALMGHAMTTPQSHLPPLHAEGPSVFVRFGVGGVGVAILLGLLSYALARLGGGATRDAPR